MSVSRNIIHITSEMRRRGLLAGAYWFSMYTTFFAIVSILYFVLENPNSPTSLELLRDAAEGKEVLAYFAKRSMAADRCSSALNVSVLEHSQVKARILTLRSPCLKDYLKPLSREENFKNQGSAGKIILRSRLGRDRSFSKTIPHSRAEPAPSLRATPIPSALLLVHRCQSLSHTTLASGWIRLSNHHRHRTQTFSRQYLVSRLHLLMRV